MGENISINDLIEKVKNTSVYTKQEREEWINKIKSGDTKAIEAAKKLFDKSSPAPSEKEIGLSYHVSGNRIVKGVEEIPLSIPSMDRLFENPLYEHPEVKNITSLVKAAKEVTRREEKKIDELTNRTNEQLDLLYGALRGEYSLVDENGKELSDDEIKNKIYEWENYKRELDKAHRKIETGEFTQNIFQRMLFQYNTLRQKEKEKKEKEIEKAIEKGYEGSGAYRLGAELLYGISSKGVGEGLVDFISPFKFLPEKVKEKLDKKNKLFDFLITTEKEHKENVLSFMKKKQKEALEAGYGEDFGTFMKEIPSLTLKSGAKIVAEGVDDMTFGLTHLSDKIKDKKVDVLMEDNMVTSFGSAMMAGATYGLALKGVGMLPKIGKVAKTGMDTLLTGYFLLSSYESIKKGLQNGANKKEILGHALAYLLGFGTGIKGFEGLKGEKIKAKDKEGILKDKIIIEKKKGGKTYKKFVGEPPQIIDKIDFGGYERWIVKLPNGEYRDIYYLKRKGLAFVEDKIGKKTVYKVYKHKGNGKYTHVRTFEELSIIDHLEKVVNTKEAQVIKKGGWTAVMREENGIVHYKIIPKKELKKWEKVGYKEYPLKEVIEKMKKSKSFKLGELEYRPDALSTKTKVVPFYPLLRDLYEVKGGEIERKTKKKIITIEDIEKKISKEKSRGKLDEGKTIETKGSSLLVLEMPKEEGKVKQKMKEKTEVKTKEELRDETKTEQSSKQKMKEEEIMKLKTTTLPKIRIKIPQIKVVGVKTKIIPKVDLLPKEKMKEDLEIKEKTKEKEMLKDKLKEKSLLDSNIKEKEKMEEKTKAKEEEKGIFPLSSSIPKPSISFGFSFSKPKKKVRFLDVKEEYKPSLVAIGLNIKARGKPKLLTGLGIRPIVEEKPKKVERKVKKKTITKKKKTRKRRKKE